MTPSPIFVSEDAFRAVDKLTRDVIALTDLELKEHPAHPATAEHWASCQMLWCRDMARQEQTK